MNALYDTFNDKLKTLLGERSPILAFASSTLPADLFGICFFFNSAAPAKYAHRCPQARVKSGAPAFDPAALSDAVLWSYDHSIFTNAAAAALAGHVYDEADAIVSVNDIPAASYGAGLAKTPGVSLFDYSLEAHKLIRPSDGKTFWIKEKPVARPEKTYRYALAEIILDGVDELELPDAYDKYLCFRLHNLNHTPALVTFGDSRKYQQTGSGRQSQQVPLAALQCKTVRRDRIPATAGATPAFTNYRVRPGYFFQYESTGAEPSDLRHYWIHPVAAQPILNSMAANNLSCPAILYDWINALREGGASSYATLLLDPHQVKDVY